MIRETCICVQCTCVRPPLALGAASASASAARASADRRARLRDRRAHLLIRHTSCIWIVRDLRYTGATSPAHWRSSFISRARPRPLRAPAPACPVARAPAACLCPPCRRHAAASTGGPDRCGKCERSWLRAWVLGWPYVACSWEDGEQHPQLFTILAPPTFRTTSLASLKKRQSWTVIHSNFLRIAHELNGQI